MLRKLLLLILIFFNLISINAQKFSNGDIAVNLGLGIDFAPDLTPALHFSAEYGVFHIEKAGTISFGVNSDLNTENFNDITTHIALRAIFHFAFIKDERFDVYAGFGSGIRFENDPYRVRSYFDEFIGARFFLTEKFGLFAEAGFGATGLKGGISWIFNKTPN